MSVTLQPYRDETPLGNCGYTQAERAPSAPYVAPDRRTFGYIAPRPIGSALLEYLHGSVAREQVLE